jgi:pyrroloquinoline quinone biosynthesis protein D
MAEGKMATNSAGSGGGEPLLVDETRPALAAKARIQVDRVTHKPVLLYPEGVVVLNETGAAILQLCDGQRNLAEIIAELARAYGTEAAALRDDVTAYLQGLYRHSLIELC